VRGVTVWLNGRILPASGARVGVLDRGFLFGDGVYETVRAYRGRPFRLGAHLRRLARSALRLGLRIPGGTSRVAAAVHAVLAGRTGGDSRVRITLTRGEGASDLGNTRSVRPTLAVVAFPYSPPPAGVYRRGVRIIVARTRRNPVAALDPAIKSNNLINNMLAKMEAARAGARDAVLLNMKGELAEGSASNLFMVRRGVLLTPALSCGILEGVTRGVVIGLARRLGIRVREGRYTPATLGKADEAFLTASTVELLPVSRAGGRRFPKARPVMERLLSAYRDRVARETVAGR
jgi:branched-chain amino acid aminotransferase